MQEGRTRDKKCHRSFAKYSVLSERMKITKHIRKTHDIAVRCSCDVKNHSDSQIISIIRYHLLIYSLIMN